MVQSYLGVLSMARCSNTTIANFRFPFFIPIVNTIVVLYFQEKEKMFQETVRNKGSDMIKTRTFEVQRLGLTRSKPEPKEVKKASFNMPKI